MPGRDRTGPVGQGPLTGKGMGICGGGRYIRYGRGYGYRQSTYFNKTDQELLLEEKAYLEKRLNEIVEFLENLERK